MPEIDADDEDEEGWFDEERNETKGDGNDRKEDEEELPGEDAKEEYVFWLY